MTLIRRVLTQAQVDTIEAILDTGSGSIITVAERNKLGFITITGAVDLDQLAADSHTHANKAVLDLITSAGSGSIITTAERDTIGHITVTQAVDLDQLELDSHTHANKAILDATTASFLIADETKLDGIEANATQDQDADEVPYVNTASGLLATDVQAAIDELDSSIDSLLLDTHVALTLKPAHDPTQESATLVGQELQLNQATTSTDGVMSSEDKTKLDGIESGATADQNASEVPYSNTVSGLTATNTQSAIDEIDGRIDTIEAASGEQNTASNVGTGEGLFAQKTGVDLEFKSIKSGSSDITVASSPTEVTITFDDTAQDLNTAARHDALTLNSGDATQQSANLVGQELELVQATASTDGVMSAEDKAKLDGITGGATPDQNIFLNVTDGSNTAVADSTSDTLEVTGTGGITVTVDPVTDKVTIDGSGVSTDDQNASEVPVTPAGDLTSTNVQDALEELQGDIDALEADQHVAVTLGGTAGDTTDDTLDLTGQSLTVNLVTPTTDGVMSAADKAKLDGLDGISKLSWAYSGARDSNINTDADMRKSDGTPINESPFVIPVACELVYITAATKPGDLDTWQAHVLRNDLSVASLALSAESSKASSTLSVSFSAGDRVRLRVQNILADAHRPSITAYFKEI